MPHVFLYPVCLPVYIDLDARLSITANDPEWEVLHVLLHISVGELASN